MDERGAPSDGDSTGAAERWRPGGDGPRASSRAALVEAAIDEFSRKGYEAATVAGIAERAGVTTGALYAHFEGKLDLLVEALGLRASGEVLRTVAAAVAGKPWRDVAPVLAREMAARPDRRNLLLLDVIVVARRDPVVARTLREGLARHLEAVQAAAEAGVDAGLVDPALGLDDLARLLSLLLFGMLVFAALDEDPPSEDAFARVLDLLLQSGDADVGDDQPAALARVRTRAAIADRARRDLHDGIAEAVAAGYSLRQVGAAAGLSHERVRRLLRERDAPLDPPGCH
jgi:AcrR family transcriptional regulator